MIDFGTLRLPPGYSMEHDATTIWWFKNPSGRRVQRFSETNDDNERVWLYVRKDQHRRGEDR